MRIDIMQARTAEELDIAYRCHHDWYALAGFIEPNAEGRYIDSRSHRADYYLAYRVPELPRPLEYDDVIGMLRIFQQMPFRPTDAYLLDPAFMQKHRVTDDQWLEASALCWRLQYSRVAIPQLYRILYQVGIACGKRYMIAVLDRRVTDLTRKFGVPLHIIGQSQFILGSEKVPVYIEMEEALATLATRNPRLLSTVRQPAALGDPMGL